MIVCTKGNMCAHMHASMHHTCIHMCACAYVHTHACTHTHIPCTHDQCISQGGTGPVAPPRKTPFPASWALGNGLLIAVSPHDTASETRGKCLAIY